MPTPQDKVREELLTRGIHDWVSLAEVDSVITDNHLAETISDKQELALHVIRSLIEDGLMKIGDLMGDGGRFRAWEVSIEGAIALLRDRYVTHYDDRNGWVFSVWLDLTESGEEVARQLQSNAQTEQQL